MSKLELLEGFDHVGSASTDMALLDDKAADGTGGWGNGLTDTDMTPVTGRDGVGLAMRQSGSTDQMIYQLSTPIIDTGGLGILCGGFAFRLNYEPSDAAGRTNLIAFSSVSSSSQASIIVTRCGGIAVTFGTSITQSAASHMTAPPNTYSQPIAHANTWHYLQFIFSMDQNLQSNLGRGWEVWLDRQLCVDTRQDGKQTWGTSSDLDKIFFYHNHTTGTKDIDDFWLSATPDRNDAVGQNPGPNWASIRGNVVRDPQVRIQFPTGDGNQNDWTPDAGTNFSSVDDDPDDGDTTYIESSLAADVDLFTFPAVGADVATNVPATMVSFTSRETVATGFNVSARTRSATNEATTGTAVDTSVATTFEAKQARAQRSVPTPAADITVTFTNGGAESAVDPPTGWTASTGYDSVTAQGAQNSGTPPATAQAGTWWFYFDADTGMTWREVAFLEQEIATVTDSVPDSAVDSGELQIEFTGYLYESSGGYMELDMLDANGTRLHNFRTALLEPGAVWTSQTFTCDVPPGTRSVVYRMGGEVAFGGTSIGAYWDTMSAVYAYASLDEFTTTEIDAAEFGVITA